MNRENAEKIRKTHPKIRKWKVAGGVLLGLVIVLYLVFVFAGRQLKEEFTGRQFVGYVTNEWSGGGHITYYCRNGIFIHSPQKIEESVLMTEDPYFIVDADEIYINMAFMGSGASFPLDKNVDYRMSPRFDQEYIFTKVESDNSESIIINHYVLEYDDSNSEEKRKIQIEEDQYNDIREMIKTISLAASSGQEEDYTYIKWKRDDNTTEMVFVEGDEVFDMIKEMYFE